MWQLIQAKILDLIVSPFLTIHAGCMQTGFHGMCCTLMWTTTAGPLLADVSSTSWNVTSLISFNGLSLVFTRLPKAVVDNAILQY